MKANSNPDIAVNLRQIRTDRGMSLKDVADKTGLTVSFLSQLEKGKTMPSISTLKSIAVSINTTISALVGESPVLPDPVIRKDERKSIKYAEGITMYLLSSSGSNNQMETLLFELSPNASSGTKAYRHFGQEFVMVLSGILEITLNSRRHVLKKGDSIYFNSSSPHSFKNISKGRTEAVWVDTPPTF